MTTSPVATALILASLGAAILGLVTVFAVLAALGVAFEVVLFVSAGRDAVG